MSIVDELRAIASRLPCSGGDCSTTTCDKARLEALALGIVKRLITCDKARLEALVDAIQLMDAEAYLRPWEGQP